MKSVRATSCSLSLDDCNFHVFDLDSDKKKVNFANNHVFQMVLGLVILKLYVQTLFYSNLVTDEIHEYFIFQKSHSDLHLDGIVHLWVCCKSVNCEVKLLGHVCQPPDYGHSEKVSAKYQELYLIIHHLNLQYLSLTFAPV